MCDHPRILVIDDEIGVAGSKDLRRFLVDAGARTDGDRPAPDYPYAFEFCTGGVGAGTFSVAAVLERVRAGWNDPTHGPWALILLDVRFGAHPAFGYDVLDAIRAAPDLGADVPVIMLTREENTRSDAAHGDASGFLAKDTVTREAVENRVFREGLIPYAAPLSDQKGHLLGRSVAFLKMLRAIRRTVRDGTIRQLCLLGESGVGKERLAVYAHDVSRGPQALFLHEFADSSNPHLQVGKIFGSWPGAYNDAPRDGRPGVFERAHGGTLFLDELQNLSPESQERLLEVRPMGSRNTRVVSRYGTAPLSEPAVLNRCRP
ncbi:MAG TPA: sigma 54-interacting transcriptional regulator, partial [Tepidisphaeraceae bacterium]|nr:sigma 54-interacting transcriptional regulator [Tepidisphaeraceae bacterium]